LITIVAFDGTPFYAVFSIWENQMQNRGACQEQTHEYLLSLSLLSDTKRLPG